MRLTGQMQTFWQAYLDRWLQIQAQWRRLDRPATLPAAPVRSGVITVCPRCAAKRDEALSKP